MRTILKYVALFFVAGSQVLPKFSSRRLCLESLEKKAMMAIDLQFLEPPAAVVAQFPIGALFEGDSSEGVMKIGSLISTVDQGHLTIQQSEAINGTLYSVGNVNGISSYVATNLSNGVSQRVDLPALLSGSMGGGVVDVEQVSGQVEFVGASKLVSSGGIAPTRWDALGNPTAVQQPPGALNLFGSARALTPSGLIGGETSTHGAFVQTHQGSFSLPKNQTGVPSTVLSISDSGNFASGAIGGNIAVWRSIGDPENGNFELLDRTWETNDGAQGTLTMFQVLDNATYGALCFGSFVDGAGDKHEAMWSPDGLIIKDFGAGAQIKDAKTIDNQTYIAYVDSTGSHILVLETGTIYNLSTLLGSSTSVEITQGGLFETTINGSQVIGVSYKDGDALKASMFSILAPTYDLSGDISASGVSLPYATDIVFGEVGPSLVNVTVTDSAGSQSQIQKSVEVRSSGLRTANGKTSLLVGGSNSQDDDPTLEMTSSGYRVTDANGISDYAVQVDQVFVDLGRGI